VVGLGAFWLDVVGLGVLGSEVKEEKEGIDIM
jgi:hypothetical protein